MAHSDNSRRGAYKTMSRRQRGFKRHWRVPRTRTERHSARTVLSSGREPEAWTRGRRHGALWDYF